tara:strand:+ start:239116 stop:240339 length:1224 start_codon:yes stop_codon:yes gene_type:complete
MTELALSNLGILGWEDIQAQILVALLANQPILLIGPQGLNKTDGPHLLAQAALGDRNCRFASYDTNLITTDDLLGFADPNKLQNGEFGHIHTPQTIWDKDAVLLDEINRASMFSVGKVMEIIRARRVMGVPLPLKFVFAALNPPGDFETRYLDLAAASRFVCVRVPSASSMESVTLMDIFTMQSNPVADEALHDFHQSFTRARSVVHDSHAWQTAAGCVVAFVRKLYEETKVDVSPRQGRSMTRMLLACEALSTTCRFLVTDASKAAILASMVPEGFGICRKSVPYDKVVHTAREVVVGYKRRDPLVTSTTLTELVSSDIQDKVAWGQHVKDMLGSKSSFQEVREFVVALTSRCRDDSQFLDTATFNALMQLAFERLLRESNGPMVSLTFDREELLPIIQQFGDGNT